LLANEYLAGSQDLRFGPSFSPAASRAWQGVGGQTGVLG
jgi:hypothetical protein